MKILVTGMGGFVGNNLAEYLIKNKFGQVYGTVYSKEGNMELVEELRKRIKSEVNVLGCDLTNFSEVFNLIHNVKPDIIFHLAGLTRVPYSFAAPKEFFKINVNGTINVMDAVRAAGLETKIHVSGSSEEYGLIQPEELPVKETNTLRPLSPYAVSKIAQEMVAWQYHRSYGLNVYLSRCFNIIGPHSDDSMSFATFAKQIAEIEMGQRKEIMVGNLTAFRDYVDVHDVCRAYWLLVNKCKVGEVYNIATGTAHSMEAILNQLIKLSKKNGSIEVVRDKKKFRPSDVPLLQGDSSKFIEATGWKPEYSIEKTLEDVMNYWREKVKRCK
ncbi:GDP-mannose 4,6-dehydratase [Candidatus Micrarchaeota archaeon]|nr:GDP-mannose 4,6-dehydratase [Candidatus Micrarchaeota archaeon]